MPELAECRLLARGNRLSVMPLTDEMRESLGLRNEPGNLAGTVAAANRHAPLEPFQPGALAVEPSGSRLELPGLAREQYASTGLGYAKELLDVERRPIV
mgnify:CR=1 FL=1